MVYIFISNVIYLRHTAHNRKGDIMMRLTSLCTLTIIGLLVPAGAFAQDWQELPDRAAIMFLTSHPDDEAIFFGGMLPYYSQVRNMPTVLVSMTSGDYWDYQGFEGGWPREQELRNAAAIYGVQYEPIFTRFKDVWTDGLSAPDLPSFDDAQNPDYTFQWWDDQDDRTGPFYSKSGNDIYGTPADTPEQGRQSSALALAQLIRDRKPTVLVTHDPINGEYGHGNHKATGIAMQAAWDLAAGRSTNIESTSITPDTLSGDPWEAAKVYLHLLDENQGALNALFHNYLEEIPKRTGQQKLPRCRQRRSESARLARRHGRRDYLPQRRRKLR